MKKLEDLLTCFHLYAVCTNCTRMERLNLKKLIDRLGSDHTIDRLRRRLRCSGCGERTEDIRIVYVGENAKLSGFHYRGNSASRRRPAAESVGGPGVQSVSSSVDSSVSPNPSTPT
jgi:hypothetical protein